MKHECGGEIDVFSVVNIGDNNCILTLICKCCGEVYNQTHYLYE